MADGFALVVDFGVVGVASTRQPKTASRKRTGGFVSR